MDLNYLLYRHQISIIRARDAASAEARYSHQGLVRGYALRIAELRETLLATLPLVPAK
jgi:hypothetical protein